MAPYIIPINFSPFKINYSISHYFCLILFPLKLLYTIIYYSAHSLLLQYNYLNLSFRIIPCPPGYDLQVSPDNNAEYTCVCTGARDDPFAVLDCDESHNSILLRVRKQMLKYYFCKQNQSNILTRILRE